VVRRVVTILALASLLWGSVAGGALAAYTDTGLDPNDTSGTAADVEWTTRAVWRAENGHRRIRVKIRAYEVLGPVFDGFRVWIDARGGPRRDARIEFVNGEGPPACSLLFRRSGWSAPAQQDGRTIRCKFPLRHLDPTKRIRWWVRSPSLSPFNKDLDVDRAPNVGWYV
jgi:hypothetical protein